MNIERKLQLIEQYDELIKNRVKQYQYKIEKLNDVDREDLESEIKLFLLRKLDNLDEEKNVGSYMKYLVNTACKKYFANRERKKRNVDFNCDTLDRRVGFEEEDYLKDMISSDYDLEEEVVGSLFVKDIFDYVRENKKEKIYLVFKLYFIDCLSYKQIGDIIGVSKQRVHQILNNLLKEIRENFIYSVDIA